MSRILPSALLVGALALTPVIAQKRSPKAAAKSFTLDPATLSPPPTSSPSAAPDVAPAPDQAPTPDQPPVPASTQPSPAPSDPPAPAAAGAAPEPAASPAPDAAANAPIVTTLGPPPSLDTPIERLIADPRTKAVLDQDLPGLSADENLGRFQQLSLRRFQPLTGGQLTPALLKKVGTDLAALDKKAETTLAPVTMPAKPRRNKANEGR